MKIRRLYSNKPDKFKLIKFEDGINIILSTTDNEQTISEENEEDIKTPHSSGKSTIIQLIDFMLFPNNSEDLFLYDDRFIGFTFFLELELIDKSYITVARSIEKNQDLNKTPKLSDKYKIINYLKFHTDPLDKPIRSSFDEIDISTDDARTLLNNKFDFYFSTQYGYRRVLPYLFRLEDNYNKILEPYSFTAKNSFSKPVILDLMGFNSAPLVKKYAVEEKLKTKRNYKDALQESKKIDGSFHNIKSEIATIEKKLKKMKESFDEFNFSLEDINLPTEMVDNLEKNIEHINVENYRIKRELNYIEKALSFNVELNLREIQVLFEEIKLYFPNELTKSYEDLISFNETILSDRTSFLTDRKKEIETIIKNNKSSLTNLNKKRQEKLKYLKEENSFTKYKELQSSIIESEKELISLKDKFDDINLIKNLNKEIRELNKEYLVLKEEIEEYQHTPNETFENLNENLKAFTKKVFGDYIYLNFKINKDYNPEFNPVTIDKNSKKPTKKHRGGSYKKLTSGLLGVNFIILNEHKNFFKFCVNDWILDGVHTLQRDNYFDIIRELTEKHDFQYIFTVLEDALPTCLKNDKKLLEKYLRREISENNKAFNMESF